MILDNDILHVEISEKGAEIVDLSKQGVQYLWNADANYWNRHAPILFPIVGRLCENRSRNFTSQRSCSQRKGHRNPQKVLWYVCIP